MHLKGQPVLVGVVQGQPMTVVTTAATFAQRFEADLVFANVDISHYTVEERSDGTVIAMPIDSDMVERKVEEFDPELREAIAEALRGLPVLWSVHALAGSAAQELARLAEELDASMIVVGTREHGIQGSLHELFNGSVAAQLAHRQRRPVVVVPLNAVMGGKEVPRHASEAGN